MYSFTTQISNEKIILVYLRKQKQRLIYNQHLMKTQFTYNCNQMPKQGNGENYMKKDLG